MSKRKIVVSTGVKASVAETQERINFTFDLLVGGAKRANVIKQFSEKHPEWNLQPRQIDNYIAKAKAEIEKRQDTRRSYEYSMALVRAENIYARAMSAHDYRAALSAQDQINRITDIYAPKTLKVVHSWERVGVTVEMMEALIAAFEKSKRRKATEVINGLLIAINEENENDANTITIGETTHESARPTEGTHAD